MNVTPRSRPTAYEPQHALRRGSVSFITTVASSVAVIDSHGMALEVRGRR